jgi:hypothetical protein
MSISRYITRTQWLVQRRAFEITAAHNEYVKATENDMHHAVCAGALGLLGCYAVFAWDAGLGTALLAVGSLGWSGLAFSSVRRIKGVLATTAPFSRLYKKPRSLAELRFPQYCDAWENLTERLPPPDADTTVEEEALKLIAALNREVEL